MNEKQTELCKHVLVHGMNATHRISQVGGGMVMSANSLLCNQQLKLSHDCIIMAFCTAIINSGASVDMETRKALCRMFLQHVSAQCEIPESVYAQLRQLCQGIS